MAEESGDPFAAFKTNEVPAAAPVKEKKVRGRKKKEASGNGQSETAQVMVPLTALDALAELDSDGRKAFGAIVRQLGELSKTTRKHIAAALAKTFT